MAGPPPWREGSFHIEVSSNNNDTYVIDAAGGVPSWRGQDEAKQLPITPDNGRHTTARRESAANQVQKAHLRVGDLSGPIVMRNEQAKPNMKPTLTGQLFDHKVLTLNPRFKKIWPVNSSNTIK